MEKTANEGVIDYLKDERFNSKEGELIVKIPEKTIDQNKLKK